MPKHIYNNVEDHRLYCNGIVCEDITSVTLPTIKHPTSEFKAAGMSMNMNMPNTSRLEAMELSVSHNNGTNCNLLRSNEAMTLEFRLVRQRYDATQAAIGHESVKYRVKCLHVSTEEGTAQTDNPLGYTEKYSIIRYEEILNGKEVLMADATSGFRINGVDRTDVVQQMLNS